MTAPSPEDARAGRSLSGWRRKARGPLEELLPGYFAMVMATGIISTATQLLGQGLLSVTLLYVAIVAFAALCALYLVRWYVFPLRMLADARAPDRAFGYFTFVAACNVLAGRLLLAGQAGVATILAVVAATAWIALTYLVPAALMVRADKQPPSGAVNGTWLIWVVATQSMAVAMASLAQVYPATAPALSLGALSLWAVGTLLYVVLIAIIAARMLLVELRPAQLSPPYWINMGATAISVFAGAGILSLPRELKISRLFPTVEGVSFMLWAFGTWWIPLLVVLFVWRYALGRVPFRYDATLWSMVFPLGMYSVASYKLGLVLDLPGLVQIGGAEMWVAVGSWVVVIALLAGAAIHWAGDPTGLPTPAADAGKSTR